MPPAKPENRIPTPTVLTIVSAYLASEGVPLGDLVDDENRMLMAGFFVGRKNANSKICTLIEPALREDPACTTDSVLKKLREIAPKIGSKIDMKRKSLINGTAESGDD